MTSRMSRTQTVAHGYACSYAPGMNSVTHGALERRHRKRVRECVCAGCERGVRFSSWTRIQPHLKLSVSGQWICCAMSPRDKVPGDVAVWEVGWECQTKHKGEFATLQHVVHWVNSQACSSGERGSSSNVVS